ncbi:MAG TPA: PAS domain-containing sensor histidine kinase, partial [Rhodothermales bacterium]|nr:PAS domain-containing sensor histidine kinase [Rhodothermales bacterium]
MSADALAALRVRARYDAAEPALHNAAQTAPDALAFLEAALDRLGRTATATRARALLADDDGAPLVTVAVWAAPGETPPEPADVDPALAHADAPALGDDGALVVPFRDSSVAGAFVVERAAPWTDDEQEALARFARLVGTLWARAGIETRLRLTLADLEDGLFSFAYGLDDVRRYALVTPQLERIVGCPASDLLARPDGPAPTVDWESLVHPDDAARFAEHESLLRAGDPSRVVYRIRRPLDGETRWVRESATPGRSPSGRPVVGGLLSDVTEAKHAEGSLLQAKQAAERASHAKTAFLAVMSHEIRSPLGAVRGFAELLVEELRELEADGTTLPPQVPEFAGVIAENTRRALHLVHRLFDLSRLETGSLALRSVPVELHPAIERVLDRHREEAEAKGLHIHFEPAGTEPVLVADPERVEEVVDHLVSNAVKF